MTLRPPLSTISQISLAALLFCAASLFAQSRPFVSFDAPDGKKGTAAGSINASGVIACSYLDSNSRGHGCVRSVDGTITEFDPPGLTNTFTLAINSKGQIVGSASLIIKGFGHSHGFLRLASGSFASVDPPGAQDAFANSINDSGTIAGNYNGADGVSHAFVRNVNGTYTLFDVAGAGTDPGMGTTAVAISSDGQIAGYYVDPSNITHGFVRHASGNITTFDAPGVGTQALAGTIPVAINAAGEVVGYYSDNHSVGHGFVRDSAGNVSNADVPGAFQTSVYGVNDQGVIVGEIDTTASRFAGFVRDTNERVVLELAPGTTSGTIVISVNDSGRITGTWFDGSISHGFVQ